ncbi:phosphonate metabolism protein PhnP [Pollutimonas harenae]|uniref:Phosphonate metabolism protein PhnP n=1 Tax=Pollutimonas harenae TaxID=657015 RepID=A0A853GUM2_9BURK|nr:phosphonate metabolism protein PhnP [Pollutimonas harenae]NYT85847.1 phosphonate metabolism protein PhnP [Pollutimonas harenae]TEA70905.1 phosphonate metabolism protein PhnP [Pollutimonas harenae]
MRLTLLGTGNAGQVPVYNCFCAACERARAKPQYRRGPCSALLEFGTQRWLVDAGLTDLAERFPPGSLSGIIQTHYHADHAQGLLHLRWGLDMSLPVLGPPDPDGLADLYKYPGILDFSRKLEAFVPAQLDGCVVTPVPLAHSKITYGYVFEAEGQRYAYLTDTVGLPPDTQAFLARQPLDLLVLDCSFAPTTTAPRNHNDLSRALDTIHALNVKQAVLTHISHGLDVWLMDEANTLPDGVVVGHDGAVFGNPVLAGMASA